MNQIISSVVVLAVVAIVAQAHKDEAEMVAVGQKCQAQEKATPADLEALMKYSTDLTHEAKCVMSCVMKHYGIFSADGKLQKDVYMKEAEEMSKGDAGMMKNAAEIYAKCSVLSDPDVCEAAYKHGVCMKNEMVARNIPLDM